MSVGRGGMLAAAVAAFLATAPGEGAAQTTLKFQASFPATSIIFTCFKEFNETVETITGGRVKIEALPAGAIVPAFEVLDATAKGVIDGAHSAPAYWVGKNSAATLFGPAPAGPWGMDMYDYLGWIQYGGGWELYQEFYQEVLKRDVVVFPLCPVPNQVLGWFKTPVKSWDDLKGRKCRQTGITARVFSKSGMVTVNMAGGEIIPAGERGVIDCAEWASPADDMQIGFQAIWKHFYMPSAHEPATALELLIGGEVWRKMAKADQEALRIAASEQTHRFLNYLNRKNADALKELQEKHGVKIERTPEDILHKVVESWEEIAKEESEKNPFFKKVYESQRQYASEVVPARRAVQLPYSFLADKYWPAKN